MVIMVILLVILSLLFIPIRLKLNIHYSKDNYYLKVYNINFYSKDGGILKEYLSKKKDSSTSYPSKSNEKYAKYKVSNKDKHKLDVKALIKKLHNNKFKPNLKLYTDVAFSLGDAAKTAIFYGLSWNIQTILHTLFSVVFSIKVFKLDINPKFKDSLLLEFTISSIITFNLAQIIYVIFLTLKCRTKIEEVIPV